MTKKKKRAKEPAPGITLIAAWGNDDADSELSIDLSEWQAICRGEELSRTGAGLYEGDSFIVYWGIRDRRVTVTNDNGADCFLGDLEDLFIRDESTGELIKPLSREEAAEGR